MEDYGGRRPDGATPGYVDRQSRAGCRRVPIKLGTPDPNKTTFTEGLAAARWTPDKDWTKLAEAQGQGSYIVIMIDEVKTFEAEGAPRGTPRGGMFIRVQSSYRHAEHSIGRDRIYDAQENGTIIIPGDHARVLGLRLHGTESSISYMSITVAIVERPMTVVPPRASDFGSVAAGGGTIEFVPPEGAEAVFWSWNDAGVTDINGFMSQDPIIGTQSIPPNEFVPLSGSNNTFTITNDDGSTGVNVTVIWRLK